jgi:Fur family iron response transcriptional regulator
MTPHHHFYNVATGALTDIDADNLEIRGLPAPPAGTAVASVDVIVRVSDEKRN